MCVLKALRLKGTARINAIGLTAAIEIQAFNDVDVVDFMSP